MPAASEAIDGAELSWSVLLLLQLTSNDSARTPICALYDRLTFSLP